MFASGEEDGLDADARQEDSAAARARARAAAHDAFADYLERRRTDDFDADAWLAGFDASVRHELRLVLDDYHRLRRDYGEHAFGLAAGARVGPFELVREVGRGGMGVVWEARQEFPRRRVALKLLYPHLSLLPSAIARFEREASVTAGLASEHIVRIFQVGVHEDLRWIAMELCEGGLTLADHIADLRRRAPPPDHARRMAALGRDMARALQSAHEKGVLHRDVKPGNILLATGLRPKLADFGLAREEQALSSTGPSSILRPLSITRAAEQVGTPLYASPEQVRGAGVLDARSDLYSLGATLHEALTLERPHVAGDERELARRILADDLPDPRRRRPSLPRDLALVVRKLGALRPEARYSCAREAAEDLQRFLDGVPVLARPPSRLERVARWSRRHATAASVAALLACSSVLLALLASRAEGAARRAAEAKVLLRSLVDLQDPRAAEVEPKGPEELARALLAAAEAQRRDDRSRAARLCVAAGRSWRIAGSLRDAAGSLRLAMELAGSDHALRLEAGEALARTLAELDDHDALRPLLAELLGLSKRVDRSPAGADPHPRTWRLACESYSLLLRCEDRAGATELERQHADLAPAGGLLEGMRARRAALSRSGDPNALDAGLQLLRALCHLDLAAEGEALAEQLLHEARHAPLLATSELRLLHLLCEARRRATSAAEHFAHAGKLADELEFLHGPDHPLALGARFRATVAALDAWAASPVPKWPTLPEVLARYEALVSRMERHLGAEHLDTLKARTGEVLVRVNMAERGSSPASPSLLAESQALCAAFRARYGPLHSRVVVAERARLGVLLQLGVDSSALLAERRVLVDAYDAAGGLPNLESFDLRNEFTGCLLESGLAEEALRRARRTLQLVAEAPLEAGVRCRLRIAATLDIASAQLLLGRRDDFAAQLDALDALAEGRGPRPDSPEHRPDGHLVETRRQVALGRALLLGDEAAAARSAAALALPVDGSEVDCSHLPVVYDLLCLRLHPAREGRRLGAEIRGLERRLQSCGGPQWRAWQALGLVTAEAAPLR